MRPSLKMLLAALFSATALLSAGTSLRAQDAPPAGGFKNAYLTVNKSGKVVLTYSCYDLQVKKGDYTLLFFWASWSDESRAQVPYVQAVHRKYDGKVKVLGVPYGDEISDTMDAMTELGITFPQLVDVDDDIAGRFELDSVPLVVLLGPDGKTVAAGMSGDGIGMTLEEIQPIAR